MKLEIGMFCRTKNGIKKIIFEKIDKQQIQEKINGATKIILDIYNLGFEQGLNCGLKAKEILGGKE